MAHNRYRALARSSAPAVLVGSALLAPAAAAIAHDKPSYSLPAFDGAHLAPGEEHEVLLEDNSLATIRPIGKSLLFEVEITKSKGPVAPPVVLTTVPGDSESTVLPSGLKVTLSGEGQLRQTWTDDASAEQLKITDR